MRFLRFLKQYFVPVVFAAAGVVFALLDTISRFELVQTFGIPSWAWSPIVAGCFLLAVIIFFYQVHSHIEDAGGVLTSVSRNAPRKLSSKERLRCLGRDAVEFAADIRSSFGVAYEFGLGLGMDPIPIQFHPRMALIMQQLIDEGFDVPHPPQGVSDKVVFEGLMRYLEFVGQYLVRESPDAKTVAARVAREIMTSLEKAERNPHRI